MLKTLCIENIAVIEKADIEFSKGFNVLTGETGAGKSIVVDSINAILGERTSKELVRAGSENAFVTAYFEDINSEVKQKLNEFDLPCEDDGTLMLSRKISAQGKSTCRINGSVCTVSMLKEVGNLLVNIHGQHDSQTLLNADYHYKFVDMYGSLDGVLDEYKQSFKQLLSVRKQLKALTLDADERDRQIELLDYQIKELTDAEIKVGEWDELKKRKNLILNSQNLLQSLNSALAAFNGSDDYSGISTLLSTAVKELGTVSDVDSDIKAVYDKAEALNDSVEVVKDALLDKINSIEFEPEELDRIEERLNLYYTFSNKYGETEQDMLYYLDEAVKKRAAFENSEEELEKLNVRYDEIFNQTVALAQKLTDLRKLTVEKLGNEICKQLEFLDMPKIKFTTSFEKGNLSANGWDKIEFLIATNVGETAKPLAKIASGGELSRIMLAIKSIIAQKDSIDTLIFDEIDTGVSGKASRKIGLKLKELGAFTQVICVTHSAQIASVADSHFLIEKNVENDRTYTNVTVLDYDGRKNELARIMGGINATESLLKSAEELLNNYGN
ncbi:DNA repair protein RecN [uncultured Eubacterium sp.]|uniref:DNA repair protein RecN n=1 Tax=uncultured Eubacterium sp. TaxID=165185 RepID=UPI0025FD2923|nr:DNA repair protein RecN [uncultured Eubacterium sp.]